MQRRPAGKFFVEQLVNYLRSMWAFRVIRRADYGGAWAFIWRITIQHYLVQAVVVLAMDMLVSGAWSDRSGIIQKLRESPLFLVVAASLETVFLQTVPIEFMRALRRSRWNQFVAGAALFMVAHLADGIGVGIAAGLVGGAYYSHVYLECRDQPWWVASFVTASAHALHNAIAVYVF